MIHICLFVLYIIIFVIVNVWQGKNKKLKRFFYDLRQFTWISILFLPRYLYFYYKIIWCRIVVRKRDKDLYFWFFSWMNHLFKDQQILTWIFIFMKKVLLIWLIRIFYWWYLKGWGWCSRWDEQLRTSSTWVILR